MAEIIRFKKKQTDYERYLLDVLEAAKLIVPANLAKLDSKMIELCIRVRDFHNLDAANWDGDLDVHEISDLFAMDCKQDNHVRFEYPKGCINEMWLVNSNDGNIVFYAIAFGRLDGSKPVLLRGLTRGFINPILAEKIEMLIDPDVENIQYHLGELLRLANKWNK